jgi:uncharacterized repeat protein (TIGR02543 family)
MKQNSNGWIIGIVLVFGAILTGCPPAPTVYTVTFNADGGTVNPTSKEVISGDAVGTLPTPTKSGNSFAGWYTDKDGERTDFTAASVVMENITVYAKWTATDGNPFKGTWTGLAPIPNSNDKMSCTAIFNDTTFEISTTSLVTGEVTYTVEIKQKGTYTYTQANLTGTITAVNYFNDDESVTEGWVDGGEFFDVYSNGGVLNGTLENGKLNLSEAILTKQ